MAVIAREPVASVPSNGNPNQGENEPLSHEPLSAGLAQPRPERNVFLHVVGKVTEVSDASFGEHRAADCPTVILLNGATVTGTVLNSGERNAGRYLSEISFEGTSFAVPQARATQVPGNFGTLTINANGIFSYTRTETRNSFSDAFTCTSRGCDPGRARITIEVIARHEEMIKFQHAAAG